MADASLLTTANLLLRGGSCVLLLMLAGLLARDHGRVIAGRLGAAFALGVAAFAICTARGVDGRLGVWAAPIMALTAGNNMVFWLFARSLFDDGFRPRPWHLGLWLTLAALGLAQGQLLARGDVAFRLADAAMALSGLAFATLAVVQTLASWRADLVERRRRLRLFIVGACAGYIVFNTLANGLGAAAAAPHLVALLQALSLAAIAGVVAWSLLSVGGGASLFPEPAGAAAEPASPVAAAEAPLTPEDLALVADLQRAMAVERLYRQENLTIGQLAARQGLPEYRLRRLINQGLGHRNFNSFLNGYRIAEARAALADRGQDAVPILTIALDAGFASLGPFNRAFKAETGLTPSAWRRQSGGPAGDSEQPSDPAAESFIPGSAGRISNSA
ncbi:helix-turn-helix domain-containing protein [Caulobacter sp. KR2-114]|uniref:AraC family transcriptional regulator n=1 Tax=Caulobacter sp. KR2-114 TaxID=3400912 RepID=UPI003BFD96C3